VNGTEAYNGGVPNEDFALLIGGEGAELVDITQFFGLTDPKGEFQNRHVTDDVLQLSDTTSPTTRISLPKTPERRPQSMFLPNLTETSNYTPLANTASSFDTMMVRSQRPSGRCFLSPRPKRPKT
jgi:hypothetical protein